MNRTQKIMCLLFCITLNARSQDVEQQIKELKSAVKQPPIAVSGAVSASSQFYQSEGIGPRRDPFYWVVNANLQVQVFQKISIPFSAVLTQKNQGYSNGLERYSHPFNQFGMSPRYKWLTVHAGYRTVEFSEYSLSGAQFVGGGLELKPEKMFCQLSTVYGRFAKAIPPGTVIGLLQPTATYERWGGGAKLRLGSDANNVVCTFLKLNDKISSIPFDTSITQTPQDNVVLSISTQQKITKQFSAAGEYAASLLSGNTYETRQKLKGYHYYNQIYKTRPGTIYSSAVNAHLNYQGKSIMGELRYKRIDPSYRSLGTIYLTNDIEETSMQISTQFFKQKVRLNVAGGIQRNNLDGSQLNHTNRLISSLNLSSSPVKNLNLQANYSSFSSNTLPVRDVFNDSIRYLQLNETAGINASYSFEKKKLKTSISGNLTYQQSSGNVSPGTNFYSAMCAIQQNWGSSGFMSSISALYNRMDTKLLRGTESFGPNLSVQKHLLKSKLKLGLTSTLFYQYLKNSKLSHNNSLLVNCSYEMTSGTSLKLDYNLLKRTSVNSSVSSFQEQRINVTLQSNFAPKKKQKSN